MLVSVGTYQHFGSADYEPASLFPESNTHEVWVGSGVERDYPEVVHEPPGKKSPEAATLSAKEKTVQRADRQETTRNIVHLFRFPLR